jgi:hypothetical protein
MIASTLAANCAACAESPPWLVYHRCAIIKRRLLRAMALSRCQTSIKCDVR